MYIKENNNLRPYMSKELVQKLWSKYIDLGILTPRIMFKQMRRDDKRRIAYEKRMILLGDL